MDAKVLKQRKLVGTFSNIYMPTYITMSPVNEGERYMIRFKPSNDDEVLRANKVGVNIKIMEYTFRKKRCISF